MRRLTALVVGVILWASGALAQTGTGYVYSPSPGGQFQFQQTIPGSAINVPGSTTGDILCANNSVINDCAALPGGAVAPSGLTINGGDISTNIPSPNGPTGAQLNIAGTQTGISTDQKNQAIFIGTFFVPGANSQLVEGILQNFTVGASPASLTEVDMFYGAGVTFDSTYNQAVLPSITFFEAQHFTNNSTATSPPFVHQFIADQMTTEGNQASLSTYNRLNFWAKGSLVSAASGNTVNNTNYEADLPSGSGAGTTNNIGVLITGAGGSGGAGTTNNWALASTSTADSYFSSRLIIDENTDSLNPELASYPTGTLINVQNADGTAARLLSTAYAATTNFTGLRFDGTKTSPTAVQSGDTVASFSGWAYNGTNIGSSAIASAYVQAAQNQTPSANGSKFCIQTTPLGSTTLATGLCQQPSSGVTLGTPTGGDTGAGTINAIGYYINGTAFVPGGIPGSSTTGDLLCANGGVVGDCEASTANPPIRAVVGSFPLPPDNVSWGQSMFVVGLTASAAGTSTSGTANQFGFDSQINIPVTGATAAYEKGAGYFVCQTHDPSGSYPSDTHYCVGLDDRAYITNDNTAGYATAGLDLVTILSGGTGDGALVGHEIDVLNNGTDQASPDTSTSKTGLLVVAGGSANVTTGIEFNQYSGSSSLFHNAIYMNPALLVSGGKFLNLLNEFTVDNLGNIVQTTGGSASTPLTLQSTKGGSLAYDFANYPSVGAANDNIQEFFNFATSTGVQYNGAELAFNQDVATNGSAQTSLNVSSVTAGGALEKIASLSGAGALGGGIFKMFYNGVEQARIQDDNTQLGIWAIANFPITFKVNSIEYARLTTAVFEVEPTTASTSTTTGSGTFGGGIGVAGAGWFGGLINSASTITGTTLNATTGFSANGTAGLASKTCTINAANVTTGITITITEGIITGTTTC